MGRNSPVTLDEIKRLYLDEKLTLQEVANRCGISKQAVHHRLQCHGIETRPIKSVEFDYDLLYRLYVEEGLTLAAVGRKLGVSSRTIGMKLKAHEISRRKCQGLLHRAFEKEIIYKLYVTDGLTQRQVGKALGVSINIIRRELRRHGIMHRHHYL